MIRREPTLLPPIAPSLASTGSPPVPESGSAPGTLETPRSVSPEEHERVAEPISFEAFLRTPDADHVLGESTETRELIGRIRERRRRARRNWVWLGTATAAIGVGVLGVTLFYGGVPSRGPGADRSVGAMFAWPAGSQRGNSIPTQMAASSRAENLPAVPGAAALAVA